jgi:hypothetical protein
VEDVGEAVPLGRALQRHDDPVVGAAVALHGLDLGGGLWPVPTIAEHRVDRVETLPRPTLWALALKRDAQCEPLPAVTSRLAPAIASGVM